MSKVTRAVYYLNQANDEWKDNEKRTIKTETGASTANQDANSTSANEGVMPRRSERLDKSMHDQARMAFEENSVAAARSKEIDSGTTGGGVRKRKSEDVSLLDSNKKCTRTRARMNAVDVPRNDRPASIKRKVLSFEERCGQVLAFKDEFGHCNVPTRYSVDPSLGSWCKTMRVTYNKIQQGKPTIRNLPQDRIERLEALGFKWKVVDFDKQFQKRCLDLEAFKRKFGHCNIPQRYSVDPSLGSWCTSMRVAYGQIQQGKPTNRNLSQDRIERLEEIGFKWKIADFDKKFEQRCLFLEASKRKFVKRCHDLEAFKKKFGHCNVPYSVDPSLGTWCKEMRFSYNQIQQGKPAKCNLSQDRIERLEEIGFKWKVVDFDKNFEKRCHDLEAYKKKFGHCNVPQRYSSDPSLGSWCSTMRLTYHQIQQGKPTNRNLSQDRIKRLEEIGFKWKGK